MAAEAEGVIQALDLAAGAHHRQRVRYVALDTAPGTDDVQLGHLRREPAHLLHLLEQTLRIEVGAAVEHVRLGVVTAADDDVAAGDLAEVQHFLGVLGVHADHRFQRVGHWLGDRHLRPLGDQRHRLAELRGKLLAPGAGRDQHLLGAVLAAVAGGHPELPADLLYTGHLAALLDYRACAPRRASEGRCGDARVGVAVVRRIAATLDLRTKEREALVQLSTAIDFQIQFPSFRSSRVGLQLGDLLLVVAHTHLTAGDEFQIVVDQLRQALP
ncbi:hypothetical protein FQZ97_554760 [compost metagenome]